MSTTVKTGWLKSKNGEKFAPQTLSSQIITTNGTLFEEEIQSQLDNLNRDITQAEYDELEANGQVDENVTYYITDGEYTGGSGGSTKNASNIVCVDENGNQSTVQNEINKNIERMNVLNSTIDSYASMLASLNERLTYIEDNLGALTTEEYTCTGSFSRSSSASQSISQAVQFDKIYLEPPSVNAVFTYNEDNRFKNITVSNITTTGCTINAAFSGNSTFSCTIKWTALGLIRKQV